jgi:hypothetical protein
MAVIRGKQRSLIETGEWTHDKLAASLAVALGGTAWQNVHLGSPWLAAMSKWHHGNDGVRSGVQRADVVTVKPSYKRFCLSMYEVKVSRQDFLSDIRSGKWLGYLGHCHRFYFAVLSGVAEAAEIPEPAGLYVRGPSGWTCRRGAKPLGTEIPRETMMSLLFMRQRPTEQQRQDENWSAFARYPWRRKEAAQKAFGKKLAKFLAEHGYYDT